jgi:GH15 family glucan-1,4-alpha-glucosidase
VATTPVTSARVEFPPEALRNYALIADGERGALCGPNGDLVWLCAPRWHDDAVLSTLIGGRGVYAVTPAGRYVWGGHYEHGTLIWRNRWVTDTNAVVECRDALPLPADPKRVTVLRRIEVHSGQSRLRLVLDLRAGFGQHPMRDPRLVEGVWTARSGNLQVRWAGAAEAAVDEHGRLVAEIAVAAGDTRELVLQVGADLDEPVNARTAWATTEREWRKAVPPFDSCIAPRDTRHAYAVMRGLTSATGGLVAAATTSLPERSGANTNYDYRYAWIRDQCLAGLAISADGPHPLLHDAVSFVTARLLEHGPDLKPAYLIDGGPVPDEESVDLPGYPGGSDVRGNAVGRQFQLDTMGEILLLLAAAARHDVLDTDGWSAARLAADVIEKRWTEPEAGIWELDDAWWTHSRLACVAGLRASAEIAPRSDVGPMSALADTLLAEVSRRCVHPDGHWQRSPEDARVDAALLLPLLRGATPPDDPRTAATLGAIRRELVDDEYVYRYRHEGHALGESEGAFLLCGFVLALSEAQQGNPVAAFRAFERNRAATGPPALLAEEFDVEQRQLRGNLPQAFVHALLLESAVRLAELAG